jgi:YD repeat-containing protein
MVIPGLEEPLVTTKPTSDVEDAAIHAAFDEFQSFVAPPDGADVREAMRPFERFVALYPNSGWSASVQTDLGLAYFRGAYFTRALDAFDAAWKGGRAATDWRAKSVIDRAVGELAKMHARLGHVAELEALFSELGDRPLTGPATELLQGAREGEWTMVHNPGVGFLCGPKALGNLLTSLHAPKDAFAAVEAARSGEHGFTLAQVDDLAAKAGLPHRLIRRAPGDPVPVPSVIHWKSHHYAAIMSQDANGRFHIQDPTFALETDVAVTEAAIDEEGSGFFLVPARVPRDPSWHETTAEEARAIYGMGDPQGKAQNATRKPDAKKNACGGNTGNNAAGIASPSNTGSQAPNPACVARCSGGMCVPDAHLMLVSLNLNDTPVGYAPQVGPPVFSRLTFNQREAGQPSTFTYFNVSPKWTLNWLTFIQDDLTNGPGNNVTRYASEGGYENYGGYIPSTGAFAGEVETGMVLTRNPPTGPLVNYTLSAIDGSRLVFAEPDGATSGMRRVFLSQIFDAQGNALTLNYDAVGGWDAGTPTALSDAGDSGVAEAGPALDAGDAGNGELCPSTGCLRLANIMDAEGRSTSFGYTDPDPLLLTSITDPFGRKAAITYASGQLTAITDVLGITSAMTYDASGIVSSLTTPYGTSRFAYTFPGCTGVDRCLELTDTLGNTERVEYADGAPNIAYSDPVVPSGINYQDSYLNDRSIYYWDKTAYAKYGTGPTKDYTKAVHYHFMHRDGNTTGWAIESIQKPTESRVWYNRGSGYSSFESPYPAGDSVNAIARLLDDGSTQLTQATLDPVTGNPLTVTDPLERTTKFTYDTNGPGSRGPAAGSAENLRDRLLEPGDLRFLRQSPAAGLYGCVGAELGLSIQCGRPTDQGDRPEERSHHLQL